MCKHDQTCIYIYIHVYLYTVMYSKFGFGSLFGNGTRGGEQWKGASPLSKKQTKNICSVVGFDFSLFCCVRKSTICNVWALKLTGICSTVG